MKATDEKISTKLQKIFSNNRNFLNFFENCIIVNIARPSINKFINLKCPTTPLYVNLLNKFADS